MSEGGERSRIRSSPPEPDPESVSLREDRSLPAPPPGSDVPWLGGEDPALALAGPARRVPLVVEGEAARVVGTERGRWREVWLDGRLVAEDVEGGGEPAVRVVASPGVARRERSGAGTHDVEVCLAAPTLPLVAFQWAPPAGSAGRAWDGVVTLRLLPRALSVRYRLLDRGPVESTLVAVDEAEPERSVVLLVRPAPMVEMTAEEIDDLGIQVSFASGEVERCTLLIAAGPPERVRTALAAAGHLDAHERRAAGARGDDAGPGGGAVAGVRLRSGVAELDDGVAWARARVAAALSRGVEDAEPEGLALSGLGALAVGEADAARAALDALEGRGVDAGWTLPLLAGRYALATGDPAPALRVVTAGRWGGRGPLAKVAARALADGLRHARGEVELVQVRTGSIADAWRRDASVRLAMVGGDAGTAGDAVLARLLAGPGHGPPDADAVGGRGSDEAGSGEGSGQLTRPAGVAAWALFAAGRPGEGHARWRFEVAWGMEGGPAGRGSWDGVRPGRTAPHAGLLLATVVHGLVGWWPDAPAGRATLAPAFPSDLVELEVEGLQVGDARIRLAYRLDGRVATWTLDPVAGRVPYTVAFAPLLPPEHPVGAVEVDGIPADLDVRPAPGGRVVPVQLSLDAPRSVRIGPG